MSQRTHMSHVNHSNPLGHCKCCGGKLDAVVDWTTVGTPGNIQVIPVFCGYDNFCEGCWDNIPQEVKDRYGR